MSADLKIFFWYRQIFIIFLLKITLLILFIVLVYLHHLVDLEKGFKALVSELKMGGYLIIYVYEDFSQHSYLEQIALKTVNLLRSFTGCLPAPILYSFCVILCLVVLVCCSLPSLFLKKNRITRKIAERIPYRHTLNPECIISDLYDRFSPPIENRYSRRQAEEWFFSAGLKDIHIINYRGWVAWAKKV